MTPNEALKIATIAMKNEIHRVDTDGNGNRWSWELREAIHILNGLLVAKKVEI